jgi:hypothetical protein
MPEADDQERAAEVARSRLAALGIYLAGSESPDELGQLQDAVERFEEAIERRGGDLMVDEGVPGKPVQPDDPHFAMPRRQAGESVASYVQRLERTAAEVRRHRSIESPGEESADG